MRAWPSGIERQRDIVWSREISLRNRYNKIQCEPLADQSVIGFISTSHLRKDLLLGLRGFKLNVQVRRDCNRDSSNGGCVMYPCRHYSIIAFKNSIEIRFLFRFSRSGSVFKKIALRPKLILTYFRFRITTTKT